MPKIFISYSHKDEALWDLLAVQLASLKRQGLIETWHDRRIGAGQDFEQAIHAELSSSDIVLLLVSPDFIASDYCYEKEMQQAMARHERGDAVVIPVILRPCDWHHAPFGKLNAVPRDGQPITRSPDRDEAMLEVARALKAAAIDLATRKTRTPSASTSAVVQPKAVADQDLTVDEHWAELSPAQARRFLEPCGSKVRTALRAILSQGPAGFDMATIFEAVDADYETEDLRGVWGGITKRVRSVLGDPEAYLVSWTETDDGWWGELTPTSHASLRKAMGL